MNTIELLGEEETFKNIVEHKITELEDNKIDIIRNYAFYYCSSLTSVSFPNVTSIGEDAFNGCSGLTSVSFPVATSIGTRAFNSCSGLTSASFPEATSIGGSAFDSCSGLTSVSIPKATSIGGSAFNGCSGLTKVSFPKATSIGTYAFKNCSGLTEVSFPVVTSIGFESFCNCDGLTSVSFPNVTSMDDQSVFSGCNGLTSVSFPVATSTGDYTFSSCNNLTEVSFPNATDIGSGAFGSCSGLTSVSIPKATSIGGGAFRGCSSLTSASFLEVTSIGNEAFSGSGLTTISFPKATSIGDRAFDSCRGLTEVSFPLATSTGRNAFQDCIKLTSVSFPKATSIDSQAFDSCSGLTSASFPEVTSISGYAFQDCIKLNSVSFPKVTSIGQYAFYSSSLTTIYVGTESDTVCTLLYTNAIPSSVTDIYVPYLLVDSYKSATNWSSHADKIKAVEQPAECIALSITADDVAIGNKTSTTVYYIAECTYTKEGVLQEGTMVFKGKGTSNSFEQNTSTTDTVQREVSFTFLGKTATAIITQGVYINKAIFVTTEGISNYGWEPAGSGYNVDGYDVYMSNNTGVDNSQAVMKLECIGYTDLTLYIRSNAESSCDYTIASIANASTYPTSSSSPGVKAHTSGKQNSGTTLSDYTAVTYTGLSGNDIIYIVFTKDSGAAGGDDRGYVLIPKA